MTNYIFKLYTYIEMQHKQEESLNVFYQTVFNKLFIINN